MSNISDTKLYIKMYTKLHAAIHMIIDGNIHDKSCQLKLNNMNCRIYYHMRFKVLVHNLVSLILFKQNWQDVD